MTECYHDGCDRTARWSVYAAYDADPSAVNPTVTRYPMPMVEVCNDHLTWELGRDAASSGSTGQWVVKPSTSRGPSMMVVDSGVVSR